MQKNVLEYLQSAAARLPNKLAFSDENEGLTFSELNKRAQAMGTYIANKTNQTNRPIAVVAERTVATLAAFMGVLYSGNYYVPIDSNMPTERISAITNQLNPLLFLHPEDLGEASSTTADLPLLEERTGKVLDIDPVYIIFTSGSTGTPKGIVITHRGVIDSTDWIVETLDFTKSDILASQSPFYFDLLVKDLYVTLKCCTTTHIIPKKLFMFPLNLMKYVEEKGTTVLMWATSAFHLLANSGALKKCAPNRIRKVITGGEAMHAKQLNIWQESLPDAQYVNLYGPTESTVECTYYIIDRPYVDHEVIPIGRACKNMEILLLDDNFAPVPDGETGEICIRGTGLALGYYGEPEKTASAFIQNPANPWYQDMLYRTGDIGMINEEGLLVYVSRRDEQIKHMGYRIELGEIETALAALPQIIEAACFYDAKNDKIVCAYKGDVESDTIIAGLRSALPKYMFPNIFLRVENLPRNANGKIDRKKLKEDYQQDHEKN